MKAKKELNLGLALLPIVAMLMLLVIGYGQYKLPIESLLLVSAAVATALAYWQGYHWVDIIDAIVAKLAKAMPVILILICVGGMIGAWMLSGTIPYMVYWGLKLISPQYIVITAFLITCATSVCTGTSWGTAGTVGVALMGVAAGLDVSLPATAGAVVSGAYFGDKLSPLSDSTNFAAIVSETDLYGHIRHLMYTTLPSFALAAGVYLFFGYTHLPSHAANLDKVNQIVTSIASLYHFNAILLVPPILVLWGAYHQTPCDTRYVGSVCLGNRDRRRPTGIYPATRVYFIDSLVHHINVCRTGYRGNRLDQRHSPFARSWRDVLHYEHHPLGALRIFLFRGLNVDRGPDRNH